MIETFEHAQMRLSEGGRREEGGEKGRGREKNIGVPN